MYGAQKSAGALEFFFLSFGLDIVTENGMTEGLVSCTLSPAGIIKLGVLVIFKCTGAGPILSGAVWYVLRYRGAV